MLGIGHVDLFKNHCWQVRIPCYSFVDLLILEFLHECYAMMIVCKKGSW